MADDEQQDAWVVHRHRVIYGDTDAMGIVYYANYLRFFEIGRTEYVRARGGLYRAMEADGLMLPVTDVAAKYVASARYDDVLLIKTRVQELGHATLTFEYRLEREDPGGAPERARAGLADGTQSGSADDSSSREAGERSRRTHHTDGELLCKGTTRHACVNRATGRATRMPAHVRAWVGPATSGA